MLHPSRYPTLFGCLGGASGRAVVVGVPYDRGTAVQHAGCAAAPGALRQASAPSHCRTDLHGLYDHAAGRVVFEAGALSDLGDIRYKNEDTDRAYLEHIAEIVRVLGAEGRRPLVLGGDHLVTLAALRGLAAAGQTFQVVQLDAHHDYHPIRDDEQPTHASFISHVAREGLARKIVQIGVRGYSWGPHEPPLGVVTVRREALAAALEPGVPVYLTVDTDGFDPTVAGAVNYPEFEGLLLGDLDAVLRDIGAHGRLIGADWTEYNPSLDAKNSLTAHFIVRGLAKIAGLLTSDTEIH